MMQHQQQHIELRQSPAEALLKLAQELPSQSALTTAMTTTRLKPATPHLSQPLALPQLTSLSDLIHDSQRYVKQQSTTVGLDKKRKAEASPATSPPILKKSHTDTDARLAVQALVPRPPGRVLKHITELSAWERTAFSMRQQQLLSLLTTGKCWWGLDNKQIEQFSWRIGEIFGNVVWKLFLWW